MSEYAASVARRVHANKHAFGTSETFSLAAERRECKGEEVVTLRQSRMQAARAA
jgi:hypothetical protein